MTDHWRERFERFAARKTRVALDAHLPPYLTEFEAATLHHVAVGNAWTRRLFDGTFFVSRGAHASRPDCSLVFVQSADRNTVASNPSTLGGGNTDAHLIYEGLSRVAADGVLAGARTIRGADLLFSTWHPELIDLRTSMGLPRHPAQIVATLSGVDLDNLLLFNLPEMPAVVITVASAAAVMGDAIARRPWVTPVVMEHPDDLTTAFTMLRSLGLRRISCIGGRQLASRLLHHQLIDDLYLTTSPRPGGVPGTPLPPQAWDGRLVVRKRGTLDEVGVAFDHLTYR